MGLTLFLFSRALICQIGSGEREREGKRESLLFLLWHRAPDIMASFKATVYFSLSSPLLPFFGPDAMPSHKERPTFKALPSPLSPPSPTVWSRYVRAAAAVGGGINLAPRCNKKITSSSDLVSSFSTPIMP